MQCLLHNYESAHVDSLSKIRMDLQKTDATICTEVSVHFFYLCWAQTNVLRQPDNEHDLQCAETDCSWQFAPAAK